MEKNTALTAITDLRMEAEDLNSRTNRAVAAAVEIGASWTQIGEALGVSKQTAHARYGKKTFAQEIRESNAASKAAHKLTEAEDKAALARYSKRRAEEEAAKIFDADVAGTSKTPSIFSDATAPAKVEDPIHQGITDTAGTVINWTGRRQFKNPKKCPFCETRTHYARNGHWWIYPDCTLTDGDYTNHDKEATK